jgi:hypothetical protein
MDIYEWLEKTYMPSCFRLAGHPDYRFDIVRPYLRCKDGFSMSVQASRSHYCFPKLDGGPYTSVEVGFPTEKEELLMPFSSEVCWWDNVYGWVPLSVVQQVIDNHGGFAQVSVDIANEIDGKWADKPVVRDSDKVLEDKKRWEEMTVNSTDG